MNKITVDEFYKRHAAYIQAVAGYVEDKRLPFILRACRLRPYRSALELLPKTPVLERWWVDEFGNTLRIGKNKRIKILFNDLKINRQLITCTDLYANLGLSDLYRISKLLYVCRGRDETVGKDVFVLSFLGRDNFFRTRVYSDSKWDRSVSPLYLGLKLLKLISENYTIRYYLKLPTTLGRVPTLPLTEVQQWVTAIPAHLRFGREIESESQAMFQTIGLEEMESIWND